MLFVVCCSLCNVRCLLSGVCCLMCVVRCLCRFVDCSLLVDVCRGVLFVVYCLVFDV